MKRIMILTITMILLSVGFTSALKELNIEMAVTNQSGNPVSGTLNITYYLIPDSPSNNATWQESVLCNASKGLAQCVMGSTTALPDFSRQYYLLLNINGSNASETIPLRSVPYALFSQAVNLSGNHTGKLPSSKVDYNSNITINGSLLVTEKIGIGTTSPEAKLDIKAAGDGSNFLRFTTSDGRTFGWQQYTRGTAGDIKFVGYSGDIFQILDSGTDVLFLGGITVGSASIPVNKLDVEGAVAVGSSYAGTAAAPMNGMIIEGNVGIGTVAPSEKLEVVGNLFLDTSDAQLQFGVLGDRIQRNASTGDLEIYEDSAKIMDLANGLIRSYENFVIDGNVGIGTTGPSEKLEVYNGDIRLNGAAKQFIANYQANTDNYRGVFQWNGIQLGNNGNNWIVAGRTNIGGNLHFVVNNINNISGTTFTPDGIEAMTILSNGNVGIGTTGPSSKLHVVGVQTTTSPTVYTQVSREVSDSDSGWYLINKNSASYTGSSTVYAQNHGFANELVVSANASSQYFYGLSNIVKTGSGGKAAVLKGMMNEIWNLGTNGDVSSAEGVGVRFDLRQPTGSAIGFSVGVANRSGVTGNIVGLNIGNLGGTNAWGIYQSGSSDKNYFAGNVGIGTTSPEYPLHVNRSVNGVSIYALGNISASDFITHSAFFEGDAIAELKKLKPERNGSGFLKVNHSIDSPLMVKFKYKVPVYKTINTTKCEQVEKVNNSIVKRKIQKCEKKNVCRQALRLNCSFVNVGIGYEKVCVNETYTDCSCPIVNITEEKCSFEFNKTTQLYDKVCVNVTRQETKCEYYTECKDEWVNETVSIPYNETVCTNVTESVFEKYEEKEFEGVSLDKSVAVLMQAVKQLNTRVEMLEKEVKMLRNK